MKSGSNRFEVPIAGEDTGTPLNLRKRTERIERFSGGLRRKMVVDCGCGGGDYVRTFVRLGADAWGIEYSKKKVAAAYSSSDLGGRIHVCDLHAISFDDGVFEVAVLNEVLEHVADEKRCLREVHRIMKRGGVLFVFSPNRLYPFETHGVYVRGTKWLLPHYFPFVPYIPMGIGRLVFNYWARNYWPWELGAIIENAGFNVVHRGWIWQTFENISGHQPWFIRSIKRPLRLFFSRLENVKRVRALGVSQVVVAEKP